MIKSPIFVCPLFSIIGGEGGKMLPFSVPPNCVAATATGAVSV